MNGSMNTKIHYLYRDADNYKVHNSCVIKGVLTPEQINVILSCCDAGEYFIPNQVGLPERKFEKLTPKSITVGLSLLEMILSTQTSPLMCR